MAGGTEAGLSRPARDPAVCAWTAGWILGIPSCAFGRLTLRRSACRGGPQANTGSATTIIPIDASVNGARS